MNEVETEQTRMIRASAAEFVRRSEAIKVARATRNCSPGYSRDLHGSMKDAGWFGLLVPLEQGGHGGDMADMAGLCEELAKGLVEDQILNGAVLVARTLVHAPDSTLKTRLLDSLVDGQLSAGVAWQGAAGGLSWQEPDAIAKDAGANLIVDGGASFVSCAMDAEGFIVSAKAGEDFVLLWVPRDTEGLTVTSSWRVDGSHVATIAADAMHVPLTSVLARGIAARDALARSLDEATVMAAAALLGLMTAAFELTRQYLCTRVQFGKPIGSFQVLAHRAVDQYVQQQLSRDSLAVAVKALDSAWDTNERTKASSRAKSRCGDAALKITREAIQMHGAIGFTDEYDAGLFLKRAVVLSSWLGNSSQHKRRYRTL